MIFGKSVLAVIPARGGSKRFPGKNLAKIGKYTLVEIAIRVARKSKYIDRIIVSSDDQAILRVAGKHAFKRPAELATDHTTSESVARHALSLCPSFHLLVLLQPTSPCRTAADIDRTITAAALHHFGAYSTCTTKPNGAAYAVHSAYLTDPTASLSGRRLERVWMPKDRSIDIDNPSDLEEAKSALRRSSQA